MGRISTNELAKYAVDQLESGVESPALARQIAAYMLEERRSRDMPVLMRAIDEELARRGSEQVVITAAHETSDDVKKQLATLLAVKNPVFSEVINPSVIGGVKARSGETQIDLTAKAKLKSFRSAVLGSSK